MNFFAEDNETRLSHIIRSILCLKMESDHRILGNESNLEAIDIYLFSNGQEYSPPRKYHLRYTELVRWHSTLNDLAQKHYGSLHNTIDLYTTDGNKIEEPVHLKNGDAYVAVEPPDPFIQAGYQKYMLKATKSWEKRHPKSERSETNATMGQAEKGGRNLLNFMTLDSGQTRRNNVNIDNPKKRNTISAGKISEEKNTKQLKPLKRPCIFKKNNNKLGNMQSTAKKINGTINNLVPVKESFNTKNENISSQKTCLNNQLKFDTNKVKNTNIGKPILRMKKLSTNAFTNLNTKEQYTNKISVNEVINREDTNNETSNFKIFQKENMSQVKKQNINFIPPPSSEISVATMSTLEEKQDTFSGKRIPIYNQTMVNENIDPHNDKKAIDIKEIGNKFNEVIPIFLEKDDPLPPYQIASDHIKETGGSIQVTQKKEEFELFPRDTMLSEIPDNTSIHTLFNKIPNEINSTKLGSISNKTNIYLEAPVDVTRGVIKLNLNIQIMTDENVISKKHLETTLRTYSISNLFKRDKISETNDEIKINCPNLYINGKEVDNSYENLGEIYEDTVITKDVFEKCCCSDRFIFSNIQVCDKAAVFKENNRYIVVLPDSTEEDFNSCNRKENKENDHKDNRIEPIKESIEAKHNKILVQNEKINLVAENLPSLMSEKNSLISHNLNVVMSDSHDLNKTDLQSPVKQNFESQGNCTDKINQTDWRNVVLEAKRHEDGHYTLHWPPLHLIKGNNNLQII